jgi:glucose-1-phosphate cytidylyltransferase
MKVVILAGGRGTRISEETDTLPKPMVEIGGKPILWHIMKIYSQYGFNEFVICLGYRGYMIKEYFSHYFLHKSDITIDMSNNDIQIHTTASEPWKVTLVDTGLDTMTGGRIKRVEKYVGKETFMLTYGDGVGNVDISALLAFHKQNQKLATITAVQPVGRFGSLDIGDNNEIHSFLEKPKGDNHWINAGYFVLEPGIFKYITGDVTTWEREPLEKIAKDGQLNAFKHAGFWKPMDTLRDKIELENLWQNEKAPWKIWE